jgi:hypothetical protein
LFSTALLKILIDNKHFTFKRQIKTAVIKIQIKAITERKILADKILGAKNNSNE